MLSSRRVAQCLVLSLDIIRMVLVALRALRAGRGGGRHSTLLLTAASSRDHNVIVVVVVVVRAQTVPYVVDIFECSVARLIVSQILQLLEQIQQIYRSSLVHRYEGGHLGVDFLAHVIKRHGYVRLVDLLILLLLFSNNA